MALVTRSSPIHSVGVFTTAPIRKGTRVVEYDGERITPEEGDRRYEGAARTYLYAMDDGKTVIDGRGLGALLNHSCDPNCEVDEIKAGSGSMPSATSPPEKNSSGNTASMATKIPPLAIAVRPSAAAPCIPKSGSQPCAAALPAGKNRGSNKRRSKAERNPKDENLAGAYR